MGRFNEQFRNNGRPFKNGYSKYDKTISGIPLFGRRGSRPATTDAQQKHVCETQQSQIWEVRKGIDDVHAYSCLFVYVYVHIYA